MLNLVIEAEDGDITVVRVTDEEVTIGRGETNTVCLPEQNVSRRHARLVSENGARYIEDIGSSNGVLLNGAPLTGRAEVREGDNVQIGDYLIALRREGQAGASLEDTDRFVLPGAKSESSAEPTPPKPARFVLTSAGFEGKEVRLEQDELRIGRQADNDVVLEHWSIWPHHARVTRGEDGTFTIEDLRPSSVKIDGKAQAKAALNSGSMIELGKVHLQFVAAGEEHTYKPTKAKLSRATVRLAAFIAVLGLAGTLLALRVATAPRRPKPLPVAASPKPDPKLAMLAANLKKADAALATHDWAKAIELCTGLESVDTEGLCRAKRERAEAEEAAQSVYHSFKEAAESGNTEEAVARYQALDAQSIYRAQAEVLWPVVREAYTSQHLEEASKAATSGRCDDARTHADLVEAVDADHEGLAPIRRRCPTPGVAPAGTTSPPARAAAAPRPKPPVLPRKPQRPATASDKPRGTGTGGGTAGDQVPKAETAEDATAKAHALLEQAEKFYGQGQHAKAVRSAQQALKLSPGEARAIRIIGISSCEMKDRKKAAWAYEKLPAAHRRALAGICRLKGITFE